MADPITGCRPCALRLARAWVAERARHIQREAIVADILLSARILDPHAPIRIGSLAP